MLRSMIQRLFSRGRHTSSRRHRTNRLSSSARIEALEPRYALTGSPIAVTAESAGFEGFMPYALFRIELVEPITETLVVNYSTVDGTALAGSDFEATSGMLEFYPDYPGAFYYVQVPLINDDVYEQNEEFFLQCTVSGGAPPLTANTIWDDELQPVVSISDATVVEGDSDEMPEAVFTLTLDHASSEAIQVRYRITDGTAVLGDYWNDYVQDAWIAAGQTTATISVAAIGENAYEADETFHVNLEWAYLAVVGDGEGVGTILNDDLEPVTFSFDNVTVVEGDSGTQVATFTLSFSRPVAPEENGGSMWVSTTSGTAAAGSDFVGVSQPLYFYTGETSKTVEVTIHGDTQFEADETFLIKLSSLAGGSYATGTGTILNDDVNSPPTAEAGGPYSVVEGGQVTLSGLGSSDPDQSAGSLTYDWDFDYDGVTFDVNATGSTPVFSAAAIDGPAARMVAVRVTDSGGATSVDTAAVTIVNAAPAANAGPNRTVNEGSSITLAGSATDGGAQDTLSYQWQLLSSTNGQSLPDGNAANYTFTPVDNGTYVFRLTVIDDGGGVGTDDVVVTVHNVHPQTEAGENQTVGEGTAVTLVGTASDPGPADTLTYTWELWSSNEQWLPVGHEASYTFTPTDNGNYQFRFLARDDDGGFDYDFVHVTAVNVVPTANAGADQTVNEGASVTLVGQGSDAGSADTLSYQWQLVSSTNGQTLPIGNTANYTFVPRDNGVYTLRMTVTDDDGGSTTDEIVVTSQNVAPTANAGPDRSVSEGSSITLIGSSTDPATTDPRTYQWELVSSSNGQ